MTAWPANVDRIRAAKVPALDALLDKYQAKLFSGYKTCWVAAARRHIIRRAVALGALPKEEDTPC